MSKWLARLAEERDKGYPKRNAFLAELTELSRRHGIVIGGCGCCGSPFLEDDETRGKGSYEMERYLQWR